MFVGVPPTRTLVAVPLISAFRNGALGFWKICSFEPVNLLFGWMKFSFSIAITKTVWIGLAIAPPARTVVLRRAAA